MLADPTTLRKAIRQERARRSPADYAQIVSDGRWVRAPHLDILDHALVGIAEGRIGRLLVSMPPRHGKSELISKYFPAWYLGRFPDRRVILASYEADFAAGWGRKVRDVFAGNNAGIFGVSIRGDSSAADRWDIDGHPGGMNTAGIGGPLTGRGADCLIIDDPLKNAEEANSATVREKHKDWWRSTAYTRLEPGGSAVIMCTRWHQDDLPGWLISEMVGGGESWEVINLPALAEEGDPLGRAPGEALWPARYPSGRLHEIRRTLGSYWFSALYQGRPHPADGGTFKRGWFRYWTPEGDGLYRLHRKDSSVIVKARDCRRFGTVDLAFSLRQSADYTAIAAWAVTPDCDLVLLDLHRERLDGPDLVPAITRMVARHELAYVGIEDTQAQVLVLKEARRKGLAVKALKADRDKVTRAIPAAVRMEAEQVFMPRSAPWLGDMEAELLSFPNGTHDDFCDVLAYATREVIQKGGPGEAEDARKAREQAEAAAKQEAQRQWMQPSNPSLWQ